MRKMSGKNMKYEIDNLNSLFSASFFLALKESREMIAIIIGAITNRKTAPNDANPDHLQNSVVNNNRTKPLKQPNTIKSFKEKRFFLMSGFRILLM